MCDYYLCTYLCIYNLKNVSEIFICHILRDYIQYVTITSVTITDTNCISLFYLLGKSPSPFAYALNISL